MYRIRVTAQIKAGNPARRLLSGRFTEIVTSLRGNAAGVPRNVVIKCAFKVPGESANKDLLNVLVHECNMYEYIQQMKSTKGTGCVHCYQLNSGGYLVLEEHGINLISMIRNYRWYDINNAVRTIVDAVETLHGLGVMHGDIKPENILMYFNGGNPGIAKLCDLDMAERFGDPCDAAVLGTRYFIAPEVRVAEEEGVVVTARAEIDMFSLGLVLWQVLNRSVTPALCANTADLDKCYKDQDALWACIPQKGYFEHILYELTEFAEHRRYTAKELVEKTAFYTASKQYQNTEEQKTENAWLKHQIIRRLCGMQKDITNLLAGQENLARRVNDLVNSNAQIKGMVRHLVLVSDTIPTLFVIVKDNGWKLDFLSDSYRLYFLCAHTHATAPCGPNGEGYEISVTKEVVKKLIPVIKGSLVLLKIALLVCGLPVQVPQLESFIGDNVEIDQRMLGFFRSDSSYEVTRDLSTAVKALKLKGSTLDAVNATEWSEEETREAYATVKSLLKKHDIPATCGLQFASDPSEQHHAWILKGDKAKQDWIDSLSTPKP